MQESASAFDLVLPEELNKLPEKQRKLLEDWIGALERRGELLEER